MFSYLLFLSKYIKEPPPPPPFLHALNPYKTLVHLQQYISLSRVVPYPSRRTRPLVSVVSSPSSVASSPNFRPDRGILYCTTRPDKHGRVPLVPCEKEALPVYATVHMYTGKVTFYKVLETHGYV